MRPVDWKELRDVCKGEGCTHDRTKGDHYIMVRPGLSRPIVIPMKKGLKERIVLGIADTLGLDRDGILERLSSKHKKPTGG